MKNGPALENLAIVADPDRNFVLIMKGGKIGENPTQLLSSRMQCGCA